MLKQMLQPQSMLETRLEDPTLAHGDRLLIGQKLAEFGDKRPGVGVKDGLPDIVWIEIQPGQIQLEDVDHVFEVKPFRLAKYPVTNVQFEAFVNAKDGYKQKKWWKGLEQRKGPEPSSWSEANCPRETVSWYEAVAFCRWLSHRTDSRIRLPTEWEWQQAATGGDPKREYPWAGGWDGTRCNSDENRLNRTTSVGIYLAGATQQGVLDLAGNVWEWCLNTYENPEKPKSVQIDDSRGQRVVRGGSWGTGPGNLRSSGRGNGGGPGGRSYGLGFRLAQDTP